MLVLGRIEDREFSTSKQTSTAGVVVHFPVFVCIDFAIILMVPPFEHILDLLVVANEVGMPFL